MRNGSRSLGEFPSPAVRIDCERCGRAGSYRLDGLVARLGADRLRAYFDGLKDEQAAKAISDIEKYLKKARVVPQPERAFMKLVFERAKRLGFSKTGLVIVDAEDFQSAFGYGITKIKRQTALLDHHGVGGLFPEDEGRASLRLYDPSNYVGWSEIDGFCEVYSLDIDRFLIELQFGLLD